MMKVDERVVTFHILIQGSFQVPAGAQNRSGRERISARPHLFEEHIKTVKHSAHV